MGCRKLSYYQGPRQIGKNHFFIGAPLEKRATEQFFCNGYYPFGLPIAQNKYEEPGNETNRFLYQGKEWQTSLALNLYDFHARQYDPAIGRFTSVDPQGDLMAGWTPYHGMGNNPMFHTDPSGEVLPLIAVAAIWGAAIGGTMYAAQAWAYQHWDWGDFGMSLGIGAVSGAATFGISNGVTSGLSSMGMGASAANFAGGFASSFAVGSVMNGGIPNDAGQLSMLAASSMMAGSTQSHAASQVGGASQAGAAATETAESLGLPDAIMLPAVSVESMRAGSYAPWWGMTNAFLNNPSSMSGFYNGSYDAFNNFFSGNQTELRWRKIGDTYSSYEHVNYIGGGAPSIGAGRVAGAAKLATNGIKLGKQLASRAQMTGKGTRIIEKLRSGSRLAKQYGGKASEWVKMSSPSYSKLGTKFETHWYQHLKTGQRVEFKTKLF